MKNTGEALTDAAHKVKDAVNLRDSPRERRDR
jgi:hypothetical protein